MFTLSLVIWVTGGLMFLLLNGRQPEDRIQNNLATLGKWGFIVGMAAYLYFLK